MSPTFARACVAMVLRTTLAVTATIGLPGSVSAGPRSELGYYVERYGLVDGASSSLAGRAERVFPRLRRAADFSGGDYTNILVFPVRVLDTQCTRCLIPAASVATKLSAPGHEAG